MHVQHTLSLSWIPAMEDIMSERGEKNLLVKKKTRFIDGKNDQKIFRRSRLSRGFDPIERFFCPFRKTRFLPTILEGSFSSASISILAPAKRCRASKSIIPCLKRTSGAPWIPKSLRAVLGKTVLRTNAPYSGRSICEFLRDSRDQHTRSLGGGGVYHQSCRAQAAAQPRSFRKDCVGHCRGHPPLLSLIRFPRFGASIDSPELENAFKSNYIFLNYHLFFH